MISGPSKAELDNYFKNNRKYFDEIAKHYLNTDREYYNKFIAPYYSNPFTSFSSSSEKKRSPAAFLTMGIAFAVLSAGIAFFVVFQTSNPDSTKKKSVKQEVNIDDELKKYNIDIEKDIINKSDTLMNMQNDIEYKIAITLYNAKIYKDALKHFKNVPEGNKNYEDAQKKIKEIEKKLK